jgi:pilus assembly protein CpaF
MTSTEQTNAFELILPYFPADIEVLILDPDISDLMFCGGKVFVDRRGHMCEVEGAHMNPRMLDSAIESIARRLGDDISKESPILDSRLPDGSRVAAVFPPCSVGGTTLTIRKFCRQFTLEELVEQGCIPEFVAELVISTIHTKQNLLVSGGTGSGKTTLLNSFIEQIPGGERLIVIEKPAELKIKQPHVVRWEAVDPLPDRAGISVSQLVTAALRHRPDRIIVGEVRDHSAYDLLQAMNSGHAGTCSTIHANSAMDALYRLSGRALSALPNLNQVFIRHETASAIDLVLHIERCDGRRQVKEVLRVMGYENENFQTEVVYQERKKG